MYAFLFIPDDSRSQNRMDEYCENIGLDDDTDTGSDNTNCNHTHYARYHGSKWACYSALKVKVG